MRTWQGKRYWLVGASEGLGSALAHKLSAMGATLVLSARDEARLAQLQADLPGGAEILPLDVTDAEAVALAAQDIGEIDGVVFLAGVYWPMTAKDLDTDHALAMADVNYLGAVRVLGAVVPKMVAQNDGHVVIIGSLSGFRGLPGGIGYSASKAAVMSLAESLYCDLRQTGVDVQLANPGFIKTRLTDKNDFKMPMLMTPKDAADEVFTLMNSSKFSRSFPVPFAWVFRLAQFLPNAIYYRLFA